MGVFFGSHYKQLCLFQLQVCCENYHLGLRMQDVPPWVEDARVGVAGEVVIRQALGTH